MHAHNGLSLGGNACQKLLCSLAGSPVPVDYDVCNHRLRPRAAHCSAGINGKRAHTHRPKTRRAANQKAQHRRHGTYLQLPFSRFTTKQDENKPTAMRTNTNSLPKVHSLDDLLAATVGRHGTQEQLLVSVHQHHLRDTERKTPRTKRRKTHRKGERETRTQQSQCTYMPFKQEKRKTHVGERRRSLLLR